MQKEHLSSLATKRKEKKEEERKEGKKRGVATFHYESAQVTPSIDLSLWRGLRRGHRRELLGERLGVSASSSFY